MDKTAGGRILKAIDLAATALWLALDRSARLAAALAKQFAAPLLRALGVLSRKPLAAKMLKSPLAREITDILNSPAARELGLSIVDGLQSMRCALDNSIIARRLLLAAATLIAVRTALWGDSGPPNGVWKAEGACVASYYDKGFLGKPTASGEIFSPYEFTAAHRTLPFDSYLKLRNIENGRETVVRVNDRGPYVAGRELDLSRAAAKALGMLDSGLARVEMRILKEKAQKSP